MTFERQSPNIFSYVVRRSVPYVYTKMHSNFANLALDPFDIWGGGGGSVVFNRDLKLYLQNAM